MERRHPSGTDGESNLTVLNIKIDERLRRRFASKMLAFH
jgi:hypothetical protein